MKLSLHCHDAIVLCGLVALGLTGPAHSSIVMNGGFETGDFTGWTPTANSRFDGVGTGPHSGAFAAFFGSTFSEIGIFQSLPTVTGADYVFSFWLTNPGGGSDLANISWNGTDVFAISTPEGATDPALPWTQFSYSVHATGTSTPIQFLFQNSSTFFRLDDISVVQVAAAPEPSNHVVAIGAALLGGSAGLRIWRTRRRAQARK